MIHVGPAGYPEGAKDIVQAVELAHSLGLDALEVEFVRNVIIDADKARKAKERAKELGVVMSAHAPYYISLNSREPETVAKSREWILRTARAAHLFGGWIIVIHCAAYSGDPSAAVTAKVAEEIGRCREALDMERVPVVLGLETMGKKGQWGTLAEIKEVMDAVPGVQPVLDFAHVHARGNGRIRTAQDFEVLVEEHDGTGAKRMHCHFSGIEYTEAGEKVHLPLGAGSPDYGMLVPILKERDVETTLICETPSPVQEAQVMRRMLFQS